MLVISHRGEQAQAPENTMASFQAALDRGVDGIETDVRLSADGKAVLFHDRITSRGHEVAKLTLAELSRQVGYRAATLEEALDAFGATLWILELKHPTAVEETIRLLRARLGRGSAIGARCMVISFWHAAVDYIRREVDVDYGLLTAHRPRDSAVVELAKPAAGGRTPALVWCHDYVDANLVAVAAEAGAKSYVYGVQTDADHRHAASCGLAGVITDRPEAAFAARAS